MMLEAFTRIGDFVFAALETSSGNSRVKGIVVEQTGKYVTLAVDHTALPDLPAEEKVRLPNSAVVIFAKIPVASISYIKPSGWSVTMNLRPMPSMTEEATKGWTTRRPLSFVTACF